MIGFFIYVSHCVQQQSLIHHFATQNGPPSPSGKVQRCRDCKNLSFQEEFILFQNVVYQFFSCIY